MSTAGVFKLIANDGKADRLIMATQLLNRRIADIMRSRQLSGQSDVTPTLLDLERTHVLFVNAHFKPYAAIGFEYGKVRPQSGNPALGNVITFSIPQFGDFFHDMVGRQVLSACNSSLQNAPMPGDISSGGTYFPQNNTGWNGEVYTPLPASGFAFDTVYNEAYYTLVTAFGDKVENGTGTYRNLVHYCEYPGERLYQHVRFDVNGNLLDEYTDVTSALLRKFTVPADKLAGYEHLVGQEVENCGYSGSKKIRVRDPNNTMTGQLGITTHLDADGAPVVPINSQVPVPITNAEYVSAGFPDNAWNLSLESQRDSSGYFNVIRESLKCVDGPQTPKHQQPQLEIWNKLRFWFNEDVRLSVPSVSIPFGQRFITIDLAHQNQIVFESPGLYVRQQLNSTVLNGIDGDLKENTTCSFSYIPWMSNGVISDITLSQVELYVNNIFVNPEIHDIFIKRVGFSLIRVYRHHRVRTDISECDTRLLSQLKWPIEYMFVGLRPTWNVSGANSRQSRDWHRMAKTFDLFDDKPNLSSAIAHMNIPFTPAVLLSSRHMSQMNQIIPNTYVKQLKTVDTLSLTAHGIKIHDNFPSSFFSAYNPYHYGGKNIVTPSDEGAMMINFALYPGDHQPSGHFNVSRSRELFLTWTTRYVSAETPADLLVTAVAINFLLISDGSAVLRYST